VDTVSHEELKGLPKDYVLISAEKSQGLEQLKRAIWEKLGLTRIYLKKIGKDPDMKEPMIIKGSPTVMDVCGKIHREFAKNFRFARVWGRTARFPGQKVGGEHRLADRDVLELHV
jgi:ribosome-interacting GTPase 1